MNYESRIMDFIALIHDSKILYTNNTINYKFRKYKKEAILSSFYARVIYLVPSAHWRIGAGVDKFLISYRISGIY